MMKKLILLLLLLNSLVACTTTKQTVEEKIQYHLDKAEEYYDLNKYNLIDAELNQAVQLSEAQYGRQSKEMAYIYLKAALYSSLSDAIVNIERAEEIFKSYDDIESFANIYHAYGRTYARKSESKSSKIAFEEALKYCDMSETDMSELKFDIYLCMSSLDNVTIEEALKYNKNAEALFENFPEQEKNKEKTRLYSSIGNGYYILKQYKLAIENYEKVIEFWVQFEQGKKLDVAQSYDSCGYSYAAEGNFEKGIEYINRSLILYEEIEEAEIWDYAIAYRHLSTIYNSNKIQDYEKAMDYGIKSCQLFVERKELDAKEMEQLKMLKDGLQELYDESPMAETQDFESWYQENIDKKL